MRSIVPLLVLWSVSVSLTSRPLAGQADVPPEWPQCSPGQVQVMLLGTFHFEQVDTADPRMDVRTPPRQAELDELTRRLATFEPDRVMVEWPLESQEVVQRIYREFLDSAGTSSRRNEAVQVGMRLARALGLETVDPIDYPMWATSDSLTAWLGRGGAVEHKNDFPRLYGQGWRNEVAELQRGSLVDFYRAYNGERHLRANNELMFQGNLAAGEGSNYGGPELLTRWYERNLRMLHHMHRVMERGDRKLFLVVGSGHIRPLRFLLDESPQFCPVSPLPYLD